MPELPEVENHTTWYRVSSDSYAALARERGYANVVFVSQKLRWLS